MSISQVTFDRVAQHLLTQNKASQAYGKCLYRSPEGLMCAVGCLIKDEHYSERLENLDAGEHVVRNALLMSDIREEDLDYLIQLQTIHDNYDPPMWKGKLEEYAFINNLKWNFD